MLVWLTLPFYDFCGFRSVAVNSVYKLQFFTFINIVILGLPHVGPDVVGAGNKEKQQSQLVDEGRVRSRDTASSSSSRPHWVDRAAHHVVPLHSPECQWTRSRFPADDQSEATSCGHCASRALLLCPPACRWFASVTTVLSEESALQYGSHVSATAVKRHQITVIIISIKMVHHGYSVLHIVSISRLA